MNYGSILIEFNREGYSLKCMWRAMFWAEVQTVAINKLFQLTAADGFVLFGYYNQKYFIKKHAINSCILFNWFPSL